MVYVVFYSGFRAATVTEKLPVIREHFPDIDRVAEYTAEDINAILTDDQMIKNPQKVEACIRDAIEVRSLIDQFGSMDGYIESFSPKKSKHHLERLRNDLQARFAFLGPNTPIHFAYY